MTPYKFCIFVYHHVVRRIDEESSQEISGIVFSIPWLIAKDHGLFEAEGIDMEFIKAQGNRSVTPTENPNDVNPILNHVPFEDNQVSIYRA